MKKISVFMLALMLAILPFTAVFAADEPYCSARGGILMEAGTGRVLFEQNADEKLPMASTTKIMTAILAIENCPLNDVVTVSKNASGTEGSSVWLEVGEQQTLEDMLYGLMLASGNDAAVAIAEHVSGSTEKFAELMNQKALEIGALNTHFVTPNGLHDDAHYTTARDLAMIAAYAMKNDTFRKIVSTQKYEIPWEGRPYNRIVNNKNKILWQYEGGNGIKTGYTRRAGRCLVAGAERDGMQLIAVVLNAPEMFEDCTRMLDFGFHNYALYNITSAEERYSVEVLNGVKNLIFASPNELICLPLSEEESKIIEVRSEYLTKLDAPAAKGQKIGSVKVSLKGKLLAESDIILRESSEENTYIYNLKRVVGGW